MAQLGLDIFDRTIQDTNTWLRAIMEHLGTEDRAEAMHALRAVLTALRDRLPVDQAANFSQQLPLLIRGLYFEDYRPTDVPVRARTLDDWQAMVRDRFAIGDHPDVDDATRAVFAVVHDQLDDALVLKTFDAMPEPVRDLWPGLPEELAHNGH